MDLWNGYSSLIPDNPGHFQNAMFTTLINNWSLHNGAT